MRPIRLLLLGGAAAYVYRRYLADRNAGAAETAAAEPYSSEQLGDQAQSPPPQPAAAGAQKDTLEQPTWLHPADGGPADG